MRNRFSPFFGFLAIGIFSLLFFSFLKKQDVLFAQEEQPLSNLNAPAFANPPKKKAPGKHIERHFEEAAPSWKPSYDPTKTRLLTHERTTNRPHRGGRAELFQFAVRQQESNASIAYSVHPSRVQDALKLSLYVRANRPGTQIALRVVFPFTRDPRTKKTFSPILYGETLKNTGKWQELSIQTTDQIIANQLVLWRGMLKPTPIDIRGMYVDRLYLVVPLGRGTTELAVDSLKYGPVVSPQGIDIKDSSEKIAQREPPDVQFRLDQLLVQKKPFFPIVVADHGEDPLVLKQSGANTVWIRDVNNLKRIAELNRNGLWVTAKPPSVRDTEGNILPSSHASMMPFPTAWDGILYWTLGAKISSDKRKQVVDWTEQIRDSDRRMRRPIHADVMNGEDKFSQNIDMLSVSKEFINTSTTFKDYRDYLRKHGELAEPGTFITTLLQTEPMQSIQENRKQGGFQPTQLEPEQLRLQLYAALSAGVRGVTYWSSTRMDESSINEKSYLSRERSLTMTQLNLELQLIEPFIASSTLIGDIPVHLSKAKSGNRMASPKNFNFRNGSTNLRENRAFIAQRKANSRKAKQEDRPAIWAAHFRCEHGQIVLPVWYDDDSQFVPGQLAASNVRIIVEGFPESAFAWEVTTTGLVPLEPKRVNGGTELTLKKLDQTSMIVISSNQKLARQLRMKIRQIRDQSARVCLDLAKEKLNRVIKVNSELVKLGVSQPDSSQILYAAEKRLALGEQYLKSGDSHAARLAANETLELTRILQRAHWNETRRTIPTPTSTQHAISFQSLPDFHRLLQKIGLGNPNQSANRLPTGDFESYESMLKAGWKQKIPEIKELSVFPELHPKTRTDSSEYCLRLTAIPQDGFEKLKNRKKRLPVISKPPIRFLSPQIPVRKGQVVYVSGWVKLDSDIQGSTNGFQIYNNFTGKSGAIRWKKQQSRWTSFRQIQEATKDGNFLVNIELNGIGDIRVDDVQIFVIDPSHQLTENQPQTIVPVVPVSTDSKNSFSGALEFLDHFPTLVPRKSKSTPELPAYSPKRQ